MIGNGNSSVKGSDQLLNNKMKNSLLLKLSRKIKDNEGLYQSFFLYNIYCNHQANKFKKKFKKTFQDYFKSDDFYLWKTVNYGNLNISFYLKM